jgi:hypothetical protein
MARHNHMRLIYLLLAPLALIRRFRRRRPSWVKAGVRL